MIRWLVLGLLVMSPGSLRADTIWCGTFAPERHPLVTRHDLAVARVPPVRVDMVRVDGVHDSRAKSVIANLEVGRCRLAPASTWNITLAVDRAGVVVSAVVVGYAGASAAHTACVGARAKELTFGRGAVRAISARVSAPAR